MIRKSGHRFSEKDHAQTKKIERDDDSKKSHPPLAPLAFRSFGQEGAATDHELRKAGARIIRIILMLAIVVVAALALLAVVTQIGVAALRRAHPAQGRSIEVEGARLNVVDIGPRDAAGPPIVMLHGASSNLEAMRQPLGDLLARHHRVILIDRPGHGWSSRALLSDSTPAIQGRMIDEALEKLGIS